MVQSNAQGHTDSQAYAHRNQKDYRLLLQSPQLQSLQIIQQN